MSVMETVSATDTAPATDIARIAQSFRRHRDSYAAHAAPQNLFARLLAHRLHRLAGNPPFGTVFEFGCGSGNLTRALASRFAVDRFALNDLVAQPLPDGLPCRASFRAGPAETAPLPERIDLLASASAIQWLGDPAAALARLAAPVRDGGWLAVSGYGPAQFHEIAALAQGAAAPSLMTPDRMAQTLPEGWTVGECRQLLLRQWFDNPQALLRHLRRTGVNGLARRGWTRRDLLSFCARYQECHGDSRGRVPLSWHPVWLIARKSPRS